MLAVRGEAVLDLRSRKRRQIQRNTGVNCSFGLRSCCCNLQWLKVVDCAREMSLYADARGQRKRLLRCLCWSSLHIYGMVCASQ